MFDVTTDLSNLSKESEKIHPTSAQARDGHNKSYLPSISISDYPVYISFQSTGFVSVNVTKDPRGDRISVMVGLNLSFV